MGRYKIGPLGKGEGRREGEVEEMGTCREEEETCTCKLVVEGMGICRAS